MCVVGRLEVKNKVVTASDEDLNDAKIEDIFPYIRRLSKLWISARCKLIDGFFPMEFGVEAGISGTPPRGGSIDELSSLVSLIDNLCLSSNSVDKWCWSLDSCGCFKVSTLAKLIQDKQLADSSLGLQVRDGNGFICGQWVPAGMGTGKKLYLQMGGRRVTGKRNIVGAGNGLEGPMPITHRLPYRVNLIARRVNIPSSLCPLCEANEESLDHCLINCPWIILLWMKVWSWWCFDTSMSIPALSISDIAVGNVGNLGN
ncbi:RNA-directed DNA polymerase, eukaryota, reverse transcriptase zinc-binding domain protein [Tanacetum coccineum]